MRAVCDVEERLFSGPGSRSRSRRAGGSLAPAAWAPLTRPGHDVKRFVVDLKSLVSRPRSGSSRLPRRARGRWPQPTFTRACADTVSADRREASGPGRAQHFERFTNAYAPKISNLPEVALDETTTPVDRSLTPNSRWPRFTVTSSGPSRNDADQTSSVRRFTRLCPESNRPGWRTLHHDQSKCQTRDYGTFDLGRVWRISLCDAYRKSSYTFKPLRQVTHRVGEFRKICSQPGHVVSKCDN